MAEVAGTVFGIISLSIQVCQGLVWYIDGVKNGNSKAERAEAEMGALANLLEVLESVVNKTAQTEATKSIRSGIVACAQAIETIREKLGDRGPPSNSRTHISLARLAARFSVPFKEPEIHYWKGTIDCIQQQLQLASHAVQLDCQDQHRLDHEGMREEMQDLFLAVRINEQSILNQQKSDHESTRSQLDEQTQAIQASSSAATRQFDSLHENLGIIRDNIQSNSRYTSNLVSIPQILSQMSRIESKLDASTVAPRTHPNVQTDIDDLTMLQRIVERQHINPRKVKTKLGHCACSIRSETIPYVRWPFQMSYTKTFTHDRFCPYAVWSDAKEELILQLPLLCLLFRRKIKMSVALSRFANSFCIKPGLAVHRIVSEESPAFRLIRSSSRWEEQNIWKDLLHLFQTRQASPHDRLANGQTLLHHVCFYIRDKITTWKLGNGLALFSSLLTLLGGDAFETDDDGKTCLDSLVVGLLAVDPMQMEMFILLLQHGVKFSPIDNRVQFGWNGIDTWAKVSFDMFLDPFINCDEYLELVFLKSELGLREHLPRLKSSGNNPERALQLYRTATRMGWVQGCHILTASGIDLAAQSCNKTTDTPLLMEAVLSCNAEMVQFWLNFRDEAEDECLQVIGDLESAFAWTAESHQHQPLAGIILTHLVNQRNFIRRLAEQYGVKHYKIKEGIIVDTHTSCLVTALLEKGCRVPKCWWPSNTSVYLSETPSEHSLPNVMRTGDPIWTLQTLYEAGFVDIVNDRSCCRKDTFQPPLLHAILPRWRLLYASTRDLRRFFEMIEWFLSKGVDLSECLHNSKTTLLHLIAAELGDRLSYTKPNFTLIQPLSNALESNLTDDCACSCNSSGCRTVTASWKGAWLKDFFVPEDDEISSSPRWDRREAIEMRQNQRRLLQQLIWCANKINKAGGHRRVISEFLRLHVFSMLGIRHTCCNLNALRRGSLDIESTRRYTPRETERIKQEDQYMTDLLEGLVLEFDGAFDEFGGNIQSFIGTKLISKMEEVLKRLKAEDQEMYGEGRKALGVVMKD